MKKKIEQAVQKKNLREMIFFLSFAYTKARLISRIETLFEYNDYFVHRSLIGVERNGWSQLLLTALKRESC